MRAHLKREKWSVVFFSALLLLAGTAIPALAGTVSVFGPNTYVRTEGAPDTFAGTFALPANVTNCRLLVSSGGSGPFAANNVSVTINGKEMVNAKSLRAADQPNAVELQSENTVFVTLKGKPGDSIAVQVLGDVPDTPPRRPRAPL